MSNSNQSKYNFASTTDPTGSGFLPQNYSINTLDTNDAYTYNDTDELDLTELINPNTWSLDINEQYNDIDDYTQLDASITSVLAALDDDTDDSIVQKQNNLQSSADTSQQQLYDSSGWENAPVPVKPAISAADLEQQFIQKTQLNDTVQQQQQVIPETVPQSGEKQQDEQKESTPGQPTEHHHLYIPLGRRHYNYMSRSELAAVIKSQLNQLQPSDILNDDFYYQVHSARHSKQVATFSNVLPIMQQQRRKYDINASLQAQSTLGRVATSNLRKPKKAMELSNTYSTAPAQPDLVPAKNNMFNNKSISYLIEEGIRVLMDIEDIDSVMSSTTDEHEKSVLQQRRHTLVDAVADSLDIIENPADTADTQHLLYTFIQNSKGRLLLFRSLLLMQQPNYSVQVIAIILIDIYALITQLTCSANDDRLISVICDNVYSTDIPITIDLFRRFLSPNVIQHIIPTLQCKLGILLCQVFLKKGHEIQQHLTNATSQHAPPHIIDAITNDRNVWLHYYNILLQALHGKYTELFTNLPRIDIRQTITNANKNKQKQTETVVNENTTPLATVAIAFEFLAALLSHATTEQRALILPDIKTLYDAELQLLTTAPFTQPLSNAIKFIYTLLYPDRTVPQPTEPKILVRPIDRNVPAPVPAYANALKRSVQQPIPRQNPVQQQNAAVLSGLSDPSQALKQQKSQQQSQQQYKPKPATQTNKPTQQYGSVTVAPRPQIYE